MGSAQSVLSLGKPLGDVLAELPERGASNDRGSLRRAAVRTLGRRSSIQPHVSLLVEDAVVLALQSLQGHAGAVTQIVEHSTLWTRWAHLDERGRLVDPRTHKGSLESTASMIGYAMKRAEAVVVSDLSHEVRFLDGSMREFGVQAGICAPIFLRAEVFGALTLCLPAAREIDADEIEFVESVATLLSTAIARTKAERDLEQMRSVADQSAQILRRLGIDPPAPSACSEILLLPPEECAPQWPGDSEEPVARHVQEHVVPLERRTSHRQPYRYWQQIAPVIGGLLPARKSFFPVLCRDISPGGLSMELDSPPTFRDMVIQLGPEVCATYLMAKVAHVTEIDTESQRKYRVGCRFTGRLQL